jgi:Tfp pilus assembly protein PilV
MPDSGHWILGATKHQVSTIKHRGALRRLGFALYEVLLGVAIFAVGVLALGRAVENCMNASMLNAEEDAVRQILSNRMAEIQAARGTPDSAKEDKVDSGYGMVKLLQKSAPAELTEPNNTQLNGINLVTLTVQWQRGGVSQSKQIQFYVYRPK